MKRVLQLCLFCSALLPAPVIAANQQGGDSMDADTKAIESAINDFIEGYNAGEVDRLLKVYSDDFIDMSVGAPTVQGKEALEYTESKLKETFANYTGNLSVSTDRISVSGDVAYTYGSFEVRLKPKDKGEDVLIHRRFLEIWRKQGDGNWKVIASMDNNVPTP